MIDSQYIEKRVCVSDVFTPQMFFKMDKSILAELGRLEAEKNFAAIEILCYSKLSLSIEFFYHYINAIFCGDFRDYKKVILVYESVKSGHTDLFSDYCDKFVVQAELRYIQSLLATGDTDKAEKILKEYIFRVLPEDVVSGVLTHNGSPLCQDILKDKSSRSGMSEMMFLLGKITADTREKRKSSIPFFLTAVYLDSRNVHAWERLASSLTVSEKGKLFSRFKWNQNGDDMREWVAKKLMLAETDDVGSGAVPDLARIEQLLQTYLLQDRVEKAVDLLERLPSDSIVFKSADVAYLVGTVSLRSSPRNQRQRLFTMSSYLLQNYPEKLESFFVTALYYLSISRFDIARKFFSKSTTPSVVDGWIGYGLSFSFSDESGHAINAFRKASRLFPSSVLPWLYMGMEYIRTNELKLAQSYLVSALDLTTNDDTNSRLYKQTILNEIGIICLKAEQWDIAIENLRLCCDEDSNDTRNMGVFLSNLGYAFLKSRDFESAIKVFDKAILMNGETDANALAGLGYCHHCKGNLSKAIDLYNLSLGKTGGNRKIENLLNNLIQLAVNEFSFSVKHTFEDTSDHMVVSAC